MLLGPSFRALLVALGRSWGPLGALLGALGAHWMREKKHDFLPFWFFLVAIGPSWPHFQPSQAVFRSLSGLPGGMFGYVVRRVF